MWNLFSPDQFFCKKICGSNFKHPTPIGIYLFHSDSKQQQHYSPCHGSCYFLHRLVFGSANSILLKNSYFVNFHDGSENVGFDFWGPWNVIPLLIQGVPLPISLLFSPLLNVELEITKMCTTQLWWRVHFLRLMSAAHYSLIISNRRLKLKIPIFIWTTPLQGDNAMLFSAQNTSINVIGN